MTRHQSVWRATGPTTEYPPLTTDAGVDVVVVGGGITGLSTALFLQAEGARVALVESDRLCAGTTGGTTGKVTSQHGVIYRELVARHGSRRAGLYAAANQWAVETVADLSRRFAPNATMRAPAYVYTTQAERRAELEEECRTATRLGLPASLVVGDDPPFSRFPALRFTDQLLIHPVDYGHALAAGLVEEGGTIHERTPALRIEESSGGVRVRTASGTLTAGHVVVATLLPIVDMGGFFAKSAPVRAYGVAARLHRDAPEGMYISLDSPTRSVRPWGTDGIVVVGESHRTGDDDRSNPARWEELEQWSRDNFEVASFEYRWSAQDFSTVDSLPYVGRSPRRRRTYVATGFNKWGLSNGTVAGSILADLIAGRESRWLPAFDSTRLPDLAGVRNLVGHNLEVGRELVSGTVARLRAAGLEDLAPGEGGMVSVDGATVGAYRDPDGGLHSVSLTCTHMGCTVRWNQAEASWDCPCHGSRFGPDGSVLAGPAVRPLERRPIDPD